MNTLFYFVYTVNVIVICFTTVLYDIDLSLMTCDRRSDWWRVIFFYFFCCIVFFFYTVLTNVDLGRVG